MFAIIGKVVVYVLAAVVAGWLSLTSAAIVDQSARHVEPVTLFSADGTVTKLAPAVVADPDGSLPNVIVYEGRTYERGWTNDGNHDSDERLWFEVAR